MGTVVYSNGHSPEWRTIGRTRKGIQWERLCGRGCVVMGSKNVNNEDWSPYENMAQFCVADFLYREDQMPARRIDYLMELWAFTLMEHGEQGPFKSYEHMYDVIDQTHHGDAPWKCLSTTYSGSIDGDVPDWAFSNYDVWYRDPDVVIKNILDNPDFDGQFDYASYVHIGTDGKRRWSDFMSGTFSWQHSSEIYEADPTTKDAMYCPIILGSDKTTVSVATGNVEYHPLYLSIGNVHNTVRRAHRNAVIPIGFLAIPKVDRQFKNDVKFCTFKRQLYHSSIAAILRTLEPGMTTPVIRRCPDGHFRRVIYDLAAYIADYPEQVLLTGIVQNWCPKCMAPAMNLDGPTAPLRTRAFTEELVNGVDGTKLWDDYGIDNDLVPFTADFPRADIHEMISPDLLHQAIKGTFKDHLVTWVVDYLVLTHGETRANEIIDDIDRRIASAPPFPGLCRFPHGRRFKQWTGDDSKALMKVFLPAIVGYVPQDMVHAIADFLEVCYLARHADITEDTLKAMQMALSCFREHREIFCITEVRKTGFSLPRQHALFHYPHHVREFGAPGGICSSITESRHITAVKKPWRRSNRFNALGQMLLTNQRLDKLAAARVDFIHRGMLPPRFVPPDTPTHAVEMPGQCVEDDMDDEPVDENIRVEGNIVLARTRIRTYPRSLDELAEHIAVPDFAYLTRRFLFEQLYLNVAPTPETPLLLITTKISSGIRGMRRECIRCSPRWKGEQARRDCAFVVENQDLLGMKALRVVRIKLLFSFSHEGTVYPCTLVEWFKRVDRTPDSATGMWKVKPEFKGRQQQQHDISVLHLDSFLRGAHLMPVFGDQSIPPEVSFANSLDCFQMYYVNKYIDHHSHEIVF
ncbi:hypothetical protein DENSPDRAFT_862058 [Dentipellis sp. KUC8613]|nr:hypothetical protein DENSPDRAFT_862058 [Dentipellis sp. KUC8613]